MNLRPLFSLPLLGLLSGSLCAQSLSPTVIASAGGTGTAGGVTLSWTVGETAVQTLDNGTNILTQGFHQADPVKLKLNMRAFLQGPYNAGNGTMNDGLRAGGLVPLQEPYTALGWSFVGGGDETIDAAVLTVTGNDAIVDWVVVELRDKNDNTVVTASRAALLQRDGDIVDLDGTSALQVDAPADDHYIAVFHRNHLGVLTFNTVALSSTAAVVDLTDGSTATFGTDAQAVAGAAYLLWSGDVSGNGVVQYTGSGNDRDPILTAIGGVVPTNTLVGYRSEDVNMNGTVQYTGAGNDRDPILQNIGGVVPTNTLVEQMP